MIGTIISISTEVTMEKQTFQFTIETPNDFIGGDVYTSDLEKAEEFCVEMGEEHGYSCVRSNVTGEIVFDYGDIMEMVAQGIV